MTGTERISLEDALPAIFHLAHASGELSPDDAEELIRAVWVRGNAQEDLRAIDSFVKEHPALWSKEGKRRLTDALQQRPGLPAGRAMFWMDRADVPRGTMMLPTIEMLLDRGIRKGAFGSLLNGFLHKWFEGDPRKMAESLRVKTADLLPYLAGASLPREFADVIRMSRAMNIDGEGLAYAWFSDSAVADRLVIRRSVEKTRIDMLRYAAAKILGENAVFPPDAVLPRRAALFAGYILRAGFDPEIVFPVMAGYGKIYSGFFDDLTADVQILTRTGREYQAALLLQIGSAHFENHGNLEKASAYENDAGDTLGNVRAVESGMSQQWLNEMRLAAYERAVSLYERHRNDAPLEPGQTDDFWMRLEQKIMALGGAGFISSDPVDGEEGGGKKGGSGAAPAGSNGTLPIGGNSEGSGTARASAGMAGHADAHSRFAEAIAGMPAGYKRLIAKFRRNQAVTWRAIVEFGKPEILRTVFRLLHRATGIETTSDVVPYASFEILLRDAAMKIGLGFDEGVPVRPTSDVVMDLAASGVVDDSFPLAPYDLPFIPEFPPEVTTPAPEMMMPLGAAATFAQM